MRKAFLMMVCAALVALVSCEKQPLNPVDEATVENPAGNISLTFNLSATHPDGADTKAVKTAWENGDVLFVFFSGVAAPKYLKLTYNIGTGVWSGTEMNGASAEALGLAESATGTMRAVFLPFGSGATVQDDGGGNFKFSTQYYSYYLTATLPYTVTGGEVSGVFDMQMPAGYVQFFVDAAYPEGVIELREPHLTPTGVGSISADVATLTEATLAHGAPLPGYGYEKEDKDLGENNGYLFSGILSDGTKGVENARNEARDYHFTIVKDGWNGTYYTKTFTGKTLYTSATTGRAVKLPVLGDWTTITDYKPIDLGCDVLTGVGSEKKRIYWSSRNLGAGRDTPEGTSLAERQATWGDYYAWGEVEPYYEAGTAYNAPPTWKSGKTGYNWTTYRYAYNSYTTMTKYCNSTEYGKDGFTDALTTLVISDDPVENDDAAHAVVGGIWRMPTRQDWAALCNTTNFTWGTFDGTTMDRKVTSQIISDGRYIFLPAAGNRSETALNSPGDECCYYSSSLATSYAYHAFYINYDGDLHEYLAPRLYGLSIRPVTD